MSRFEPSVPAPAEGDGTTSVRSLRCREPELGDAPTMWRLACDVGLDENSPYAYLLWADHFAQSSIVATANGDEIVGFVTGFHPPRDPDALFVWQIGVAESARGRGVGSLMLDTLLGRTAVGWLEATVTPSNAASASLFRSVGVRHGAPVDEALVYPADLFPDGHEPEVRFRIGPLAGAS